MKSIKCIGLLTIFLVFFSSFSSGAVINFNGYTRNLSANIVTDGELEWLGWDATLGLSINSALDLYSDDGWMLASNSQVTRLFNQFFAPGVPTIFTTQSFFAGQENRQELISIGVADRFGEVVDRDAQFLTLFGGGSVGNRVGAFFGSDRDGDNLFNAAIVFDDNTSGSATGRAFLDRDRYEADDVLVAENFFSGVALVRTARLTSVPELNTRTKSMALALLFALAFFRLNAKRSDNFEA